MDKAPKSTHLDNVASFLHLAICEIAGFNAANKIKLFDFGCGQGQLVEDLQQYGYDAYGADVWTTYDQVLVNDRLKKIETNPYRIPFEDNSFDIVVSTSVLEHAQNTKACFEEIYRILKPGGYAMHIFPGKWYLPSEPHLYVPLVNWFWPRCPDWWLLLWAILGIRNEFQQEKTWKEVYQINKQFCRQSICYRTTDYYQRLSMSIFGNFTWPMTFHINHAGGGFNKIAKKLPFKSLLGFISREFRMGFLVTHKVMGSGPVND